MHISVAVRAVILAKVQLPHSLTIPRYYLYQCCQQVHGVSDRHANELLQHLHSSSNDYRGDVDSTKRENLVGPVALEATMCNISQAPLCK